MQDAVRALDMPAEPIGSFDGLLELRPERLRERETANTKETSAITSKPATCDRLKSGHFASFGDEVDYFELDSFVKLAAL